MTIGELPSSASRNPWPALPAIHSPWPMTTSGRPVRRPYASAIVAPIDSSRTWIVRIVGWPWRLEKIGPV